MKVPLQRTYFDGAEEKAVISVLRSGWVTQGPKVEEFENVLAKFVGVKYAIATTSATTALFLCLHNFEIGVGDEVLVPSLSFIATANVVSQVGATPIFVDIDPRTYNIDPAKIEEKITKKTRAIIPVDQVGLPADLDQILKIAKKYKLHVIEDAACSLGSAYKGKRIGSFGEAACFSFHPRKLITTGEGGMIVTNNKVVADKLRILRHQGMSVSDVVRHQSTKIIFEKYPVIGYNFRMSDIQAAVGLEQMKKLTKILDRRAYLANYYTNKFLKSSNIISPYVPSGYTHNWQSYVIRIRKNKMVTRNELMQKLMDAGITTRIGIMAAHLEKPYKSIYPELTLPETELAAIETIALPLYFQMTRKEQDYVINKIMQFSEN